VFTNIYLMTQGGPQFSTTTIVYMIYDTAFRQFKFGPASAMAMILFAITSVLAVIQFKWLGQTTGTKKKMKKKMKLGRIKK
jgi:multiple sugar transport system permease protein